MQQIEGSITAAKGYKTAGLRAGIKPGKTNKDMALIYSEVPAQVAGTFTTNKVKAAPVKWDQLVVNQSNFVQAVIINTGVANACTGQMGMDNAKKMAELTAQEMNLKPENVLVASTGVIGAQLPMPVIQQGIIDLVPKLQGNKESATKAAQSILTTDTHAKEVAVTFLVGGKTASIGGMAKGSGMIHPNMGTMLGFITTDVSISKDLLQEALLHSVKDTYNMVSVDGDTSTNDTVLLLANGLADNKTISMKDEDYKIFVEALNYVNTYLAKQIAGDGEGATHLFQVIVEHAGTKEDASALSKVIVTSNLTKAAIYGSDANWGRILCAMGYSGVDFDPDRVDIYIESEVGSLQIVNNGMATDYSEETAKEILSAKEVTARADVNMGEETATAWGCDLTYDYVKINADYRS